MNSILLFRREYIYGAGIRVLFNNVGNRAIIGRGVKGCIKKDAEFASFKTLKIII